MSERQMSISAFARRSMLSPKALRLYDESGLLQPERVDPATGYRYYVESQLERARLISLLRRLDVPLRVIAQMLDAASDESSRLLDDWWLDTEAEFERRRELLRYIRGEMIGTPGRQSDLAAEYEINIRRVPETTYLFISKHVIGPELPDFIGESNQELQERSAGYGGAIGSPTVVFRGIVDMDSDGPVDVCLPINHTDVFADDIRKEAAHTQAYVRLLKRQIEFPQILRVYQAIRTWIDVQGHQISGPPREVYLGAWDSAESTDPICDIAFPIHLNLGENDV